MCHNGYTICRPCSVLPTDGQYRGANPYIASSYGRVLCDHDLWNRCPSAASEACLCLPICEFMNCGTQCSTCQGIGYHGTAGRSCTGCAESVCTNPPPPPEPEPEPEHCRLHMHNDAHGGCVCDSGYYGTDCACGPSTCGSHGKCSSHGTCECDANYFGSTCAKHCGSSTCGAHGKCGPDGECVCDAHYTDHPSDYARCRYVS